MKHETHPTSVRFDRETSAILAALIAGEAGERSTIIRAAIREYARRKKYDVRAIAREAREARQHLASDRASRSR